jgi:hypothetical protein
MINPAARYHRWLDDARDATTNPALHRLIDDVQADLTALGPLSAELGSVVRGALTSIAAAIEVLDGHQAGGRRPSVTSSGQPMGVVAR